MNLISACIPQICKPIIKIVVTKIPTAQNKAVFSTIININGTPNNKNNNNTPIVVVIQFEVLNIFVILDLSSTSYSFILLRSSNL